MRLPEHVSTFRRRFWAAVWLAAVTLSCVLHVAVLAGDASDPAGSMQRDALLPVANVLCLPGVVVTIAADFVGIPGFGSPNPLAIALAHIVGWGAAAAVLVAFAWIAHRAASPARREPPQLPTAPAQLSATHLNDPASTRRRFLVQTASAGLFVGVGATGARAAIFEPNALVLRRYRVNIRDLPPELDGFRIAQISDTHLGPIVPRSLVEHAVSIAADLDPDLVVLTGDMIESTHGGLAASLPVFAPLATIGAGCLAVLGNHDWYGNGHSVRKILREMGITTIDNDRVFIDSQTRRLTPEAPGDGNLDHSLCITGLGDLLTDVVDPARAFRHVSRTTPRILLAHNPDTLELRSLASTRIDLALCGHTHGGQVRLPFIGPPLVPSAFGRKYAGGLVSSPVAPAIISRGVGTSGLPVRLGVPPEVVEIELRRAPSSLLSQ